MEEVHVNFSWNFAMIIYRLELLQLITVIPRRSYFLASSTEFNEVLQLDEFLSAGLHKVRNVSKATGLKYPGSFVWWTREDEHLWYPL